MKKSKKSMGGDCHKAKTRTMKGGKGAARRGTKTRGPMA